MNKSQTGTVLSILMGTILEWYDFSLIASMAPFISTLFFPSDIPLLSLLAAFGVFASGFVMRPIGGAIFGHIGDRHGRKEALSLTILMMAVPTTLIGLLPTFATIGIMGPIFLLILRMVQGVASSGEYPGAICFLTEIAPQDKRGLWGSLSMFGVAAGILLGSLFNSILTSLLTEQQMYQWGWRIPFLAGLPLGIFGWYLRYQVRDSEIFKSAKLAGQVFKVPLQQIIEFNFANLMRVILFFSMSTISFYLSFVYVGTYLVSTHKISLQLVLENNMISVLFLILLIPLFGYLSDKTNRKSVMLIGLLCLFVSSYPVFLLYLTGEPNLLLMGQLLTAFFLALFVGPLSAFAAEIFSTFTRFSGVSFALNLGSSIFGGTCPLLAAYLVHVSGHAIIPAIYPMIFGFFCFIAIGTLKNNQNFFLNQTPGQAIEEA